jgi:hypothetical protein
MCNIAHVTLPEEAMGYKWITVEGSDGKTSFKVSGGGDEFWIYDGSDNSIGRTRSMEDAITLIKATYGKKVWNVDIGSEQSGCFPASTLILTPAGWKRIGRIQRGDEILSLDRNLGRLKACKVTRRLDHHRSLIWEVHTSCHAKPVLSTAIHPFLSTRGWIQASLIEAGDDLIGIQTTNSCRARVVAVVKTNRLEPVHNLYTTGEHNFIADGFVVHNFAYFRAIRTLWHRLAVDPFVIDELQEPRRCFL